MARRTLVAFALLTSLLLLQNTSSSGSLVCKTWTGADQEIPPPRINDGYCDCPHDGSDEVGTGACAGSMDGMWAGLSPRLLPSDADAAVPPAAFACRQQPALRLPLSRLNDGICDCCDGSDEATDPSLSSVSTRVSCPDICDEVLAEERARAAKLRSDFDAGFKIRGEAIEEYDQWRSRSEEKLHQLRDVDLENMKKGKDELDLRLATAKLTFARDWMSTAKNVTSSTSTNAHQSSLKGMLIMDETETVSFILSLCMLAAEISAKNLVDGRCLALDRASLDLGILWDHSSYPMPTFTLLDSESKDSLSQYAESILLRIEGKEATKGPQSNDRRGGRHGRNDRPPPPDMSSGDDLYGDDWEDYYDDYDEDVESPHQEQDDGKIDSSEGDSGVESPNSSIENIVEGLIDSLPLDRSLFQKQSRLVLNYSPPLNEEKQADTEESGDIVPEDSLEGAAESEAEDQENEHDVDPMALEEVKLALGRLSGSVARGEMAVKSAARYIVAMQASDTVLDAELLALMVLYHSKISARDVAELIYMISSDFKVEEDEATCSAPWAAMCPPRTTASEGGSTYPPTVIVEAAREVCDEREGAEYVCSSQIEEEPNLPSEVSDGYYNYYEPRARDVNDGLSTYFQDLDAKQAIPADLSDLMKQRDSVDKELKSLSNRISSLERELGDDSDKSKYGADGELYTMRDSCHKVEQGKYEYEVCIFGKATQRDIGQRSGGTNLGQWNSVTVDENSGKRLLKWTGGTKCWNGPVRSAEVAVTCGAETKLLSADEPETCRYTLEMESPIGCDESFKLSNAL